MGKIYKHLEITVIIMVQTHIYNQFSLLKPENGIAWRRTKERKKEREQELYQKY